MIRLRRYFGWNTHPCSPKPGPEPVRRSLTRGVNQGEKCLRGGGRHNIAASAIPRSQEDGRVHYDLHTEQIKEGGVNMQGWRVVNSNRLRKKETLGRSALFESSPFGHIPKKKTCSATLTRVASRRPVLEWGLLGGRSSRQITMSQDRMTAGGSIGQPLRSRPINRGIEEIDSVVNIEFLLCC